MRRRLALVAAVAMFGCGRERVYVTSTMLHSHLVEIREHGQATVETTANDTFELARDATVKVKLGGETRAVTVATLIAGCPDHRPFAGDDATRDKYRDCGLLRVGDIEVDRRWVGKPGVIWSVVGIVLVMAVVGVVFGYLGECAEPDDGC